MMIGSGGSGSAGVMSSTSATQSVASVASMIAAELIILQAIPSPEAAIAARWAAGWSRFASVTAVVAFALFCFACVRRRHCVLRSTVERQWERGNNTGIGGSCASGDGSVLLAEYSSPTSSASAGAATTRRDAGEDLEGVSSQTEPVLVLAMPLGAAAAAADAATPSLATAATVDGEREGDRVEGVVFGTVMVLAEAERTGARESADRGDLTASEAAVVLASSCDSGDGNGSSSGSGGTLS